MGFCMLMYVSLEWQVRQPKFPSNGNNSGRDIMGFYMGWLSIRLIMIIAMVLNGFSAIYGDLAGFLESNYLFFAGGFRLLPRGGKREE
jgi:hypothetical protein